MDMARLLSRGCLFHYTFDVLKKYAEVSVGFLNAEAILCMQRMHQISTSPRCYLVSPVGFSPDVGE